MSVDMTKWCEIAKANMGKRPAGEGRLGGKICIVTGAAQGFGKGIAEELYKEGATIVIADMSRWQSRSQRKWASAPSLSPSTSPTRNPSRTWSRRRSKSSAGWI